MFVCLFVELTRAEDVLPVVDLVHVEHVLVEAHLHPQGEGEAGGAGGHLADAGVLGVGERPLHHALGLGEKECHKKKTKLQKNPVFF